MKKSIFWIFFSLLFASNMSYSQITKTFEFKDFNSVEINSAFDVTITQADIYSVSVIIDENLEDNLDIELKGKELEIGLKGWNSSIKQGPKAIIQLPDLRNLELSGASEIQFNNLNLESLDIESSGASLIKGTITIKKLTIEASGASSIELKGKVNQVELYLSGASEFNCREFEITDEMIFDASGASTAKCLVNGDMYIKLEGASELSYSGEGDVVKKEVSGASTIEQK